jgi:hypothetical protein
MPNSLTNEKLWGIEHAHFEKKGNELKEVILGVSFTMTTKDGGLINVNFLMSNRKDSNMFSQTSNSY